MGPTQTLPSTLAFLALLASALAGCADDDFLQVEEGAACTTYGLQGPFEHSAYIPCGTAAECHGCTDAFALEVEACGTHWSWRVEIESEDVAAGTLSVAIVDAGGTQLYAHEVTPDTGGTVEHKEGPGTGPSYTVQVEATEFTGEVWVYFVCD